MDAEDLPEIDAASTADPQRALEGDRFAAALDRCLVNLAEARRLAVTLYLQGHRIGQAAELLGWTNKKTENLVYRGLADLRQCLRAKGIAP